MSEPSTELLPSDPAIDCLLRSMANGAFTEEALRNEARLILSRLKDSRPDRWSGFETKDIQYLSDCIDATGDPYDYEVAHELGAELTRRAAAKFLSEGRSNERAD